MGAGGSTQSKTMKDSIPPLVKGHSVAGNSSSSDFADVKAKFLDAKKKGKTNRDIFNQLAATNDSLLADATETGMPWQSLGGEHSESYDSSSGSTTMQLGKSGSMLQQRQQQQQQQRESADSLSGNSRPRLKTFDVLYQTDNNIMVPAEVACPRRVSELGTSQARHRHHRRNQIFAQGLTAGDLRRISQLPAMTAVDHSKEVFQIKNLAAIMGVLGRFFLPNDTQTENFGEADHILAQFEKEVVEQGEWLMREGEEGYKMYIITEGSLKVFIDDKNVRALGPGDAVGELALLYSAPRSASVQAAECSTLWSLTRDKFRSVQAFAGSANVMQRCNMLSDIIELDVLDKYSLSKLASVMEPVDLSAGEVLFTEGQLVDRCILIERGQLEATQTGPPRLSNVDLDKVVGASHTKNKAAPQRSQDVPVCYGSGLLLGIPAMLCVGGGVRGVWDPPESSGGKVNPKGAICPVTLTATSGTRIGIFTIAQFEDTVGPISEVFSMRLRGRPSLRKLMSMNLEPKALDVNDRFVLADFETVRFLGTGSFGRVNLVRFKDEARHEASQACAGHKYFALKMLSKRAIMERGQYSHVKDERLLLQNLAHPFVLKLFASFQDVNAVYFLLEAVGAGEMWSVIYESLSGYSEGRLPIDHGRFYAANVIEALSYMHSRGVAYRDLKPENIMIDKGGYLRVIDLGFAKKIPFTVEVDGQIQVHPKSFTMCGTPEYLAPEFVFNWGHDRSVDLWAFGVFTFELTAGYTPFQPPAESSDMTALFTRIACSKRDGIQFPADYDKKAKGKESRDLVQKLMHPDPVKRLGNTAAGTDGIKKHSYFNSINWEALVNKEVPPPWQPSSELGPAAGDDGNHKNVPAFTGDQSLFADW